MRILAAIRNVLGLAICVPLMFVMLGNQTASAVVLPVCSTITAVTAPAPIEAEHVALYLVTNVPSPDFELQWLDPNGNPVAFDLVPVPTTALPAYYLRPHVPIEVSTHTLIYSDHCTNPPKAPIQLPVKFGTAPPPPARLGTLTIDYEAYCPEATGVQGTIRDFPPPVRVRLALEPGLEPYAAFIHLRLTNDSGLFAIEQWNLARSVFPSLPLRCAGISPSLPAGMRTFVAEAEIIDGPQLMTVSDSVLLECPVCEDHSAAAGAGAGPMLSLPVAGRASAQRTPAHSHGCSVANVGSQ